MMKDREFLQWIHDRLKTKHGENVNVDYMHRLRDIIDQYPVEYDPNYGDNRLCDTFKEAKPKQIAEGRYEDSERAGGRVYIQTCIYKQ